MKYDMTAPCSECPFKNDKPGFLTKARAKQIASSIIQYQQTFSCHKTNEYDDEGGDMMESSDSQHCGGAMIFLEKINRPNQMMRIAERLGIYNHQKLDMQAPVVGSVKEFIALQETKRKKVLCTTLNR